MFGWLKNSMPRGIYARAALILVMPVVLLQLLISVVFIQRHFDGVTQSMTRAMNIELRFMIDIAQSAPDAETALRDLQAIADPLEIAAALPAEDAPADDIKPLEDLTGNNVIEALRRDLPEIMVVSLEDRRRVVLWLETRHGPMKLDFSRRRVS